MWRCYQAWCELVPVRVYRTQVHLAPTIVCFQPPRVDRKRRRGEWLKRALKE